jgi:hypothetical protein
MQKILIITLVFEKTPFFAENWQKSQKIVIITSTPGAACTGDRCYDFKNISVKKNGKKWRLFAQTAIFYKNLTMTLVFKKHPIFSPKVGKIADNIDHRG